MPIEINDPSLEEDIAAWLDAKNNSDLWNDLKIAAEERLMENAKRITEVPEAGKVNLNGKLSFSTGFTRKFTPTLVVGLLQRYPAMLNTLFKWVPKESNRDINQYIDAKLEGWEDVANTFSESPRKPSFSRL